MDSKFRRLASRALLRFAGQRRVRGGTKPSSRKSVSGGSLVGVDLGGKRGDDRCSLPVIRQRPARLRIIGAVSIVWTGLLIARMYSLQVSSFETWQSWALKQHVTKVQVAAERGAVLDRNGKSFAVSVPTESLYVRPTLIKNKGRTAQVLAKMLSIPQDSINKKLNSKQPFVWIKRQVPRFQAQKITDLKIAGVGSITEARRFYPYNNAASALIGKVGIDGNGLSGIERIFEKHLRQEHVETKVAKDAFGKVIQTGIKGEDGVFSPPRGTSVQLTLDADLQIIMDEELEKGRKSANAKQAMAVMIDSETGEIIAMSQSPSYNFNDASETNARHLRNLLVEAVFEPGSVMKPIVAAAALDAGVVRSTDLIDCENGRFSFSRHVIKDVHPSKVIPFYDVVVRSSNIGMSKIGIRMGPERLFDSLKRFGFGAYSGLGLPGESAGILRRLKLWSKVDVATHSFGQGIAVTPLQIVRAVAAIANGGVLPTLSVVIDEAGLPKGERVISSKAALAARDMMYGVVEDEHGTGKRAAIEGIRVGGKTGTAQKASKNGRGYQRGAYVASFVGFADGSPLGVNRNLTTIVAIDEPNTTSIYGGTLAGPVFRGIVDRSLRFLATKNRLGINRSREPLIVPAENLGLGSKELLNASYSLSTSH
jgi:cell division protein FtsI (penicillin-binding protein 3)